MSVDVLNQITKVSICKYYVHVLYCALHEEHSIQTNP